MNSSKSRVPTTRIGRFARLSLAAGQVAVGGMTESLRRLGDGGASDAVNVFLTANSAGKLARHLAGMRGAAMKMGQMLSMESAAILPREFADALAQLRDAGHTMPLKQLNGVLGREYGKNWRDRFEYFDPEPIAAASIGQVHRACTRGGQELALKIQYPGVARSIDSDVDNMAMFLRLAKIMPVEMDTDGIVREAKRQLHQEADYLAEAGFLEEYREKIGEDPRFLVPRVHRDLTTRRILAMDYVSGQPLDFLFDSNQDDDLCHRVASHLEELVFREIFDFGIMQSDPNFANYLIQPDTDRIILLDFGSTVRFDPVFVSHYRQLARALVADDYDEAVRCATLVGYLGTGDSEMHIEKMMELIALICEPVLYDEDYDFGETELFARMRDLGLEMAFGDLTDMRVPPPETMFLHRKLMGSFMLCHRLGARFNVQALVKPLLVE